ncbi:hypothetical protein RRG08_028977 [Elysia crispata]|uniref:Uncharacterized protein n=1 Tax=Elysia crispata TaxID=231223 RepID=A0AAE1EDV9_9GAST|nr:hypothetical protein RRG08_028977 [Elysia crispata]
MILIAVVIKHVGKKELQRIEEEERGEIENKGVPSFTVDSLGFVGQLNSGDKYRTHGAQILAQTQVYTVKHWL